MPSKASIAIGAAVGAGVLGAVVWLATREQDDIRTQPITGDALLLRDGERIVGHLIGCSPDACFVDGGTHPRAKVEWIALAVEDAHPPAVRDATQDELHTRDGAVRDERLLGIDQQAVYTPEGNTPRSDVAWIHLAQPLDVAGGGSPDSTTPTSESRSEGPSTGSSGGRTRRGPGQPVERCPADAPLGGNVRVVQQFEERHSEYYDCRADGSFWFELESSLPGQWPSELGLVWKSRDFGYRLRNHGCRDVDEPARPLQHVCTQPAGDEVAGRADNDEFRFHATRPELLIPGLPSDVLDATVKEGECHWEGGSTRGSGDLSWSPHFTAEVSPTATADDSARVFRVDSSGCLTSTGDPSTDCLQHPDRFAVIPFTGEAVQRHDDPPHDNEVVRIRWAVCCGCGEEDRTPFGDDPSGPPPCPSARNQAALLDVALDQQDAYLADLTRAIESVHALERDAANWQNDFEQAMRDCNLWGAARTLVGILATGGAGGGEGIPHIEQFSNLLSTLESVAAGDGSWLLPDHEFGDWGNAQEAWDAFNSVYGALGSGSPSELRQQLQECGAPTLNEVLDGAYQYLDIARELETQTRAMNEARNRLRSKDQETYDLWRDYQEACRADVDCSGGDSNICDVPPRRT